jgi:hypothetical protein
MWAWVMQANYSEIVKSTFVTKALRTVLVIDDEFPSYANLLDEKEVKASYKEWDRALALYKGFKAQHMVCDVENDVDTVGVERLRKSDLVILDYNLGPDEGDHTKAIKVIRNLAAARHFNTIVVYTAAEDLDRVWLEIAASLTGGWTDWRSGLDGEAAEAWDRLSDSQQLPDPGRPAVVAFVGKGGLRAIPADARRVIQQELVDASVPPSLCSKIIEALCRRNLAEYAGAFAEAGPHADKRRVHG